MDVKKKDDDHESESEDSDAYEEQANFKYENVDKKIVGHYIQAALDRGE